MLCLFAKLDRKSTRLNSSHQIISYAVFCLKKKKFVRRTAHSHLYPRTTHVTCSHLGQRTQPLYCLRQPPYRQSLPSCAMRLFFFNHTPTTEIYTLSLHDALPIFSVVRDGEYVHVALGSLVDDPTIRPTEQDRKSTRLNSSHQIISYAVFCLK